MQIPTTINLQQLIKKSYTGDGTYYTADLYPPILDSIDTNGACWSLGEIWDYRIKDFDTLQKIVNGLNDGSINNGRLKGKIGFYLIKSHTKEGMYIDYGVYKIISPKEKELVIKRFNNPVEHREWRILKGY